MVRILLRGVMPGCFWLPGFLILMFPFNAAAQNTSNKGKDFWLGYGLHVGDGSQQMSLYITSDVNTTGKIEIPGIAYSSTFTVTANSITIVPVPQQAFLDDEGYFQRGIHVTAEKPIVVYGHIYDQNVSGASLILPVAALGKEYYSINYKQVSNNDDSFSFFLVVATEDNTEVEITPSVKTKKGREAGQTFKVNLSKGQVYQVLGEKKGSESFGGNSKNFFGADLTGSIIKSVSTGNAPCKRIAVFSGSGKIGIGCRPGAIGSSDNLFQQVYPTASWGKKFITVPLASRNYDVIRVLKSSPNAVVKLNGNVIPASDFTNSFYYDFKSKDVNVIESNQPIQIAQYGVSMSQGYDCTTMQETNGDPEMIFLNPVEQNIDDITVYSPGAFAIRLHYINVVIKTEAVPSFKLDGMLQETNFKPVPGNPDYSVAQLSIPNAGVHHLQASQGFNAIAYGFGNAESYGYSAGTNLKGMNVHVENRTTGKRVTSGCVGADLSFRIDLVYPVNRLTWNFKNGSLPVISTYTQADSTYVLNGNTFYVYRLSEGISFPQNKDYEIEVIAEKINSDGCGSSEIIPIDFSVYSSPVPDFTSQVGCMGEETVFTDISDNRGKEIKKWTWDFGDGTTSEEQHPRHVFAEGKEYEVKLTVSNSTGCEPVTETKLIRVIKKPVVDFSNTLACVGEKVVFADRTISEDEVINSWIWDLGDSTTLTQTSLTPLEHTYEKAGTYTVKLLVTTATSSCTSFAEKTIVVNPKPIADFILPEVCISDVYAEFANVSSISDNTGSQLQYLWNFGDPNSDAQRPNISSQKNGGHEYLTPGTYTVTLTVTSATGCSHTISKICTVNGGSPEADFVLQDSGPHCSDKEVGFVNRSRVSFGSITRLEWYYDLENYPDAKEVDEDPQSGKVYFHKYPTFYSPATKTVRVKLLAYSGSLCVDDKEEVIILNGIAQVNFNLPTDLCLEDSPVQLSASNAFNHPGRGVFSGRGISAAGLFRPSLAGEGIHSITYTFQNDNGCDVSLSKDIAIWASPVINLGDDRTIVAFGQTQLKAEVNMPVVSYKWEPSTGLSRDDIPDPIASPISKTTYMVTVISEKGCTSTRKVTVDVLGSPNIPNTFTPNGDGINDLWEIKYLESLPKCSIKVFNRYGQIVFQSIGYSNPWDGRTGGQNLPEGAYYYMLDPGNGKKVLSGSLNILR